MIHWSQKGGGIVPTLRAGYSELACSDGGTCLDAAREPLCVGVQVGSRQPLLSSPCLPPVWLT